MANAAITGKHPAGWITISTDEYESMKETIEVLSDVDIMEELEEGKKEGAKVRDFEDNQFFVGPAIDSGWSRRRRCCASMVPVVSMALTCISAISVTMF